MTDSEKRRNKILSRSSDPKHHIAKIGVSKLCARIMRARSLSWVKITQERKNER